MFGGQCCFARQSFTLINCLMNKNNLKLLRYADKYISRCTPILSGCKSEMFNNELSTSAALGQFQKKLSVVESKDDSVQKSSTTEDEQTKPDISHVKSDTPATRTVRRAPVTKPEPEEYRLPYHDEKRVTSEQRNYELKSEIMFDDLALKWGVNKETFLLTVKKYISKESLYRRGAVEFVYAGLREMKRFGLERDLTAYKALLTVFPEGKMIPRNAWQVEFMHYPRQQQCIIDMLEQMESKAVIPDREYGRLLKNRFGNEAHVTRKYRRICYWLPKFKNMNPYPIPYELPTDAIHLALLALKRMVVDRRTRFTVWRAEDLLPSLEGDEAITSDFFIASAQSTIQKELIEKHDKEDPLFVEGPFPVFMKHVRQNYFVIRAEPNVVGLKQEKDLQKKENDEENLFEWTNFFDDEKFSELQPALSIHEQEDSTVLALGITSNSSKHSAVQWVRCLEQENPTLSKIPVLFQLQSNDSEIQTVDDGFTNNTNSS